MAPRSLTLAVDGRETRSANESAGEEGNWLGKNDGLSCEILF